MNIKTMKHLFALAAATLLTFGAQAKNYTTIFSQDFEDAETYKNELSGGSVASTVFGTSETSSATPAGTITQEVRTNYNSQVTSAYLQGYWQAKGKKNDLITLPTKATNVTDFVVEFDYLLHGNYYNSGSGSGLVIQGEKDVLATFYVKNGVKEKGTTSGGLYDGDSNADGDKIGTVTVGTREQAPNSTEKQPYWIHVTITGNETDGLTISAEHANGTKIAENYKLAAEYQRVTKLYMHSYANNTFSRWIAIDDIFVKEAVAADTYTWTGNADNRWANAANWTVGGAAAQFCPGESDAAEVKIANQTIIVEPGQKFGSLDLDATTKFQVNFTSRDQTFTLPTGIDAANVIAKPFVAVTEGEATVFKYAPANYVWNGGDAAWNVPDNWLVGGEKPVLVPGADDTVTFDAAAAVTIDGTSYASNVCLNAAVTFAGDKLKCSRIVGEGKLTLNGVAIAGLSAYNQLVISNDIEVASDSVNTFTTEYNGYATVHFEGDITGSGEIVLDQRSVQGSCGGQFKGDNGAFAGKVTVVNCKNTRDTTAFYSGKSTSSNAVYTIYGRGDYKYAQFKTNDETYYFGALNGSVCFDSDAYYQTMSGITLEIGALGIDCAFGGNLKVTTDNKGAIRKVGKGVLTCSASYVGHVDILDGTYRLGGNVQSGTVTFLGGKMAIDPGISSDIDYALRFADSTSAIVVDDEGVDRTWATAIAESNVGGFTKQGAGTLTLSAVPEYSGDTTVEAGVLLIPSGTAFETLAVTNGAKVGIIFSQITAEGVSFTADDIVVPEGKTVADVLVQSPTFSSVVKEEGGKYTITVTRRSDLVYTWTGAADDSWANAANWMVDGEVPCELPQPNDTVLFPAEGAPWTNVVLASEATVTNLTLEGDTTFSGALIQTGKVEGDGKITFAGNAGLHTYKYASARIVVSNDLHVTGDNNGLVCEGYAGSKTVPSWGTYIDVYGNLTGDGTLYTEGLRSSVLFAGTNTAFAGTMDIRTDGIPRHNAQLLSPAASSSNAVWNVANAGNESFLIEDKATYWFGALSGTVYMNKTLTEGAAVTFEIGAREDVDSVLGGKFSRQADRIKGEGSYIRKIGASRLDFSGYWTQGMEVNGGVLKIADARNLPAYYIKFLGEGGTLAVGNYEASSNVVTSVNAENDTTNVVNYIAYADPSSLIKDSTAPIAFDDEGTNVTWATALAASNVGGFTKKGAGTLTLAEIPLYTGVTAVEAGTLVVPSGTEVTIDAASTGTLTGATVTNAVFATAETTTTVVDALTTVKTFDCPLDCSKITVDLSAKTDWTENATYYVQTSVGVVAGTSVRVPARGQLILPEGQAGKWTLRTVAYEGKRVLAVMPRSGLIVTIH